MFNLTASYNLIQNTTQKTAIAHDMNTKDFTMERLTLQKKKLGKY